MAEKRSSKSKSAAKPYPEAANQPAGKVAEGLATYTVRSTPKPRATVRTIAGLEADDEVWEFVKMNNLLPHLETAIRLTRETFPTWREMKLAYEPDPESSFFNAVVIYVKAVGTVEELFEQENRYIRAYGRHIPRELSQKIVMLLSVVA
jgi:hypothetical protein